MTWKKYILNKFFITGFAFVAWMTFFDQESFIDQYQLSQTLGDLESKKQYYLNEITNNELNIDLLQSDSTHIEKFAREKYFMKKDNEEVFVIIRDTD